MFGYVRIYKPELKMAEYEHYQGVYCSLCKQLGKRYGFLARMTLSYDLTFLALFRMALEEQCIGFQKGFCLYHPLSKRVCCKENDEISFSADAAALLIYYKIKDNISDRSFISSLGARFFLPFAALSRRKARKRQPELDAVIRTGMDKQAKMESSQNSSIDAAAEPFAEMMSKISKMTAKSQNEQLILERFGYCLGRWIYLIDAVDDLEEDLDQKSYNPYILSRKLQEEDQEALMDTKKYSLLTLNACLAECIAAYNLLTIHRFDGIIRNILEQGMPAVQKQVTAKKGNKHERK